MKKILILTVAMLFVASMAFGWTVVNSKHDMRGFITGEGTTQVCVYCHTPHQASAANSQAPLWNHSFGPTGGANYGVYTSTTLNAAPAEIQAVVGSASTSKLCMTCHDGTVAVNALYKAPKDSATTGTLISVTGAASLGTSLVDDHPINFTYDAALVASDGGLGLVTPDSAAFVDSAKTVPLFGGKVQCASCHDVHNNTNLPFLVVSNASSALCVKCHLK